MVPHTSELAERLRQLAGTYRVPGAVLGILCDGDVRTVASGVLNLASGVPATPESIFQIGSITKTYTAALVQRLVERDELDLDATVRSYLPGFRVGDATASATVTLRHLLTHSSGIDGDHFVDTGRGDDALEKYVASCAGLGQQFPVGATMSYCNAGFGVIGHVLEKVTGKVWDEVLRDELVTPLGLTHTMTLPEEVLRFGAACGHVGPPDSLRIAPQWQLPRSCSAAGLVCASAADVLLFAKAFMDADRAPRASAWLDAESVAAMLAPQVEVPNPYTFGKHWGLGWMRFSETVVGHDGATIGQSAFLRVVPSKGVAVVLLTNGGGAADLSRALLPGILAEVAGETLPPPLEPVDDPVAGDPGAWSGRYVRAGLTCEIEACGAGLTMTLKDTSGIAGLAEESSRVVTLLPVAEDTYVGRLPGAVGWTPAVFFTLDGGCRYLHLSGRAAARAG